MDIKSVLALALGALAVLLDIVGIAIPYWNYKSVSVMSTTVKGYQGLWKVCESTQGQSACLSISSAPAELTATRALAVLGTLCAMVALVCFVLRMCIMKERAGLNKVAAAMGIAAGVLLLIGVAVYGAKFSTGLHAAFGMVIVGALSSIVSAVCMCLSPTD